MLLPGLPLLLGIPLALPAATTVGIAATQAIEAPITAVTVYSDSARVTRSARITLSGAQRLELPLLLDSVDPATIRLEATQAEVQRVDIAPVSASTGALPTGEATELLDKLERLDDQISRAEGEQRAYQAQHDLLRRISPAVPQADPLHAAPRLNPTGWGAMLDFLRTGLDRAQERLRATDEHLRVLREERAGLAERARLLGAAGRRAGFRVVASVSGHGPAQVALTYVVSGARWVPAYDIQLWPAKNQVELFFSGQVSQETGEDWLDAQLTLSTAVPSTATQIPRLTAWRIGERERFIPTPVAASEASPPPPPAPPIQRPGGEHQGQAVVQRLLQRAGVATVDRDGDGIVDQFDREARSAAVIGQAPEEKAKLEKNQDYKRPAPEKPATEYRQRTQYNFDDKTVAGDLVRPDGAPVATPAAPPPPPPPQPVMAESVVTRRRWFHSSAPAAPGAAADESRGGLEQMSRTPAQSVGLLPPAGYRPPIIPPHLPAALAGGYDLTFPGLGKESVRSGKGARRVALLSRTWPVAVSRQLFPALAPEAFLVAEIKNPSDKALPGGQASLFVGADPAGVATLKLVAPGEAFTLPLGLDRAVKPVRNVRLSTQERGVFSKDEITEYVVTTEVVNPYGVAIALRLTDQLPMTDAKNVEIKLVRADPPAQPDKYTGALEWRLNLAPGGKAVTTFVYTLRRPKGYRLYQ